MPKKREKEKRHKSQGGFIQKIWSKLSGPSERRSPPKENPRPETFCDACQTNLLNAVGSPWLSSFAKFLTEKPKDRRHKHDGKSNKESRKDRPRCARCNAQLSTKTRPKDPEEVAKRARLEAKKQEWQQNGWVIQLDEKLKGSSKNSYRRKRKVSHHRGASGSSPFVANHSKHHGRNDRDRTRHHTVERPARSQTPRRRDHVAESEQQPRHRHHGHCNSKHLQTHRDGSEAPRKHQHKHRHYVARNARSRHRTRSARRKDHRAVNNPEQHQQQRKKRQGVKQASAADNRQPCGLSAWRLALLGPSGPPSGTHKASREQFPSGSMTSGPAPVQDERIQPPYPQRIDRRRGSLSGFAADGRHRLLPSIRRRSWRSVLPPPSTQPTPVRSGNKEREWQPLATAPQSSSCFLPPIAEGSGHDGDVDNAGSVPHMSGALGGGEEHANNAHVAPEPGAIQPAEPPLAAASETSEWLDIDPEEQYPKEQYPEEQYPQDQYPQGQYQEEQYFSGTFFRIPFMGRRSRRRISSFASPLQHFSTDLETIPEEPESLPKYPERKLRRVEARIPQTRPPGSSPLPDPFAIAPVPQPPQEHTLSSAPDPASAQPSMASPTAGANGNVQSLQQPAPRTQSRADTPDIVRKNSSSRTPSSPEIPRPRAGTGRASRNEPAPTPASSPTSPPLARQTLATPHSQRVTTASMARSNSIRQSRPPEAPAPMGRGAGNSGPSRSHEQRSDNAAPSTPTPSGRNSSGRGHQDAEGRSSRHDERESRHRQNEGSSTATRRAHG
ncbi:uncharacterized protein IWZ02DRAFT_106746 [Phyllosticta citriasiana]|uniref:uncharacterized protein n=1 Tax=Phyllosticta citriasiana TaxID=595635 RepID=UPI0030FD46AC